MQNDVESYRPFFNRRISPAIRELIVNRRSLLVEAAQFAARHFRAPMPQGHGTRSATRWTPPAAPSNFTWKSG